MKRVFLTATLLFGVLLIAPKPTQAMNNPVECYVRITYCSFGSGLKLKCASDATLDPCRRYNCETCDLNVETPE